VRVRCNINAVKTHKRVKASKGVSQLHCWPLLPVSNREIVQAKALEGAGKIILPI